MLIKQFFINSATFLSLRTILYISTIMILLGLFPLSLKQGLIFFQNVLLSKSFFPFKFLKNFILVFLSRFTVTLRWHLYLHQFSQDLFLLKIFLSLSFDRRMILFLNSLEITRCYYIAVIQFLKVRAYLRHEGFFLEQCVEIIVSNAMKLHIHSDYY